jgi:hypothetical protein
MNNITAIVNVFKRPQLLKEQIDAIRSQTLQPSCIIILNNGNTTIDLTEYKNDKYFKVCDNNFNSGVWSRFIIGYLAETEYISIFDDDTIPGCNWFKNCMDSMNKKEALYGTIGVLFRPGEKYIHMKRYGWDGASNDSKPVDIVGHSWFFKKEWLTYFTREPPQIYSKISNGEDIHFSHMLRKYGNIPTYVPPHPPDDISMFGSIPKKAWKYGCDGNSETGAHYPLHLTFSEYLTRGFKRLVDRQTATSTDDFNFFRSLIIDKIPFALIRPADGEYHVLQNKTLTNIDNWTFTKDSRLSSDLNNALEIASNKNCYFGIPCNCCNRQMARWYVDRYKLNPLYTTFANVFVNKNWKHWVNLLKGNKVPFIYVGPYACPPDFFMQQHIMISEFLVNHWDLSADHIINSMSTEVKKHKNMVFLFSCGPIAKILIARSWAEHPYNIYLDAGSSLDLFTKNSSNREYAIDGSPLSKLECKFDTDLIRI